MARSFPYSLLVCCISFTSFSQETVFRIHEKDLIPEGIAYDPVNEKFFISSTYKRKIIEIDKGSGAYRDFIAEKQDDITGVLGMQVDAKRRVLWAVAATAGSAMPVKYINDHFHHTGVYKYDLNTRKLVKKYILKPAQGHFLNDLTILSNGTLYITDTQAKQIYTIDAVKDSLELFYSFPEALYPNGITHSPDEKQLLLAVYKQQPHSFVVIDRSTKVYRIVALPDDEEAGADGISYYNGEIIAIQPVHPIRVIARYMFDGKRFDGNPKIETVVASHPSFIQPTTGVIVGDDFYFIAASQLQHFRRLFTETKGAYPIDNLSDALIMRVRLK